MRYNNELYDICEKYKKNWKKSLIYKFLACINIFVDEMGA